jgi:hypothetical protein
MQLILIFPAHLHKADHLDITNIRTSRTSDVHHKDRPLPSQAQLSVRTGFAAASPFNAQTALLPLAFPFVLLSEMLACLSFLLLVVPSLASGDAYVNSVGSCGSHVSSDVQRATRAQFAGRATTDLTRRAPDCGTAGPATANLNVHWHVVYANETYDGGFLSCVRTPSAPPTLALTSRVVMQRSLLRSPSSTPNTQSSSPSHSHS